VDKSLVRRLEARGEPRLGMLETVREYAADELARLGDGGAAQDRHLAWCLDLVAGADRGLEGADQGGWLELRDLELPNLRAALARAIDAGDAAAALALAGATRRFWHVRGYHEEGRRWFERALELAGAEPGPESIALTGLGILLGDQGDYEAAERMFGRALELSRQLGDPGRVCSALNNLGVVSLFQGRPERAAELYRQAYEIALAHELPHPTAFSLENMGCARLLLGDVDGAIEAFRGALELMREAGELRANAVVEGWLACALIGRGDLVEARQLLAQSLPVVQGFGFRQGIAGTVGFVAMYALAVGNVEVSARLVGAAEAVWAAAGARPPFDAQAQLDRTTGELRAALGDDAFERAASEGRSLDDEQTVALAEAALAG
jgi:non-specific serine/threonine protein kinase